MSFNTLKEDLSSPVALEATLSPLSVSPETTESELEAAHEGYMSELGYDKYYQNQVRLKDSLGETFAGKKFFVEVLPRVAPKLQEWLDTQSTQRRKHVSYKFLKELDVELLSYLALTQIVTSQGTPLLKVMSEIGGMVLDHIYATKLGEVSDEEVERFEYLADFRSSYRNRKALLAKFLETNGMTEAFKGDLKLDIKIAEPLVDAVLQGIPEFFTKAKVVKNNKSTNYLNLTEEGLQWFSKVDARRALGLPRYLPMLVEPEPWDEAGRGGGYVNLRPYPLITSKYGSSVSPAVAEAVNTIQRTAFTINKPVHDLVKWCLENNAEIGKLPKTSMLDLPVLEGEPTEETLKKHKRNLMQTHKVNRERSSQTASFMQHMDTAELLLDKTFWFPCMLDFRGRVYAKCTFNHQTADPVKAQIMFAEGKPLGERGAMWLAIHLANTYGLDKKTFQERVAWVDDNEGFIKSIAKNPKVYVDDWAAADEPFSFVAACIEYAGYLEQGESFVSHLGIALDASCSGIQLYSAALLDKEGALHTNLLPAEQPQDIYKVVADKVLADLNKGDFEGDDLDMCKRWLDFGVNRKTVKRNVMTFPYSSGQYGFSNQILEDTVQPSVQAGNPIFEGCQRKASNFLAKLVYKHVQGTVVKAAEGMNWLKKAASLLAREGKRFEYITPLGLKMVHAYHQHSLLVIDSPLINRFRATLPGGPILRADGGYSFTSKQKTACAPNVIHSLDATLLLLTSLNLSQTYGINNVQLIHDSFAVHACDTDSLFECIRESMVELFEGVDVFNSIYEQVYEALSETGRKDLPLPPEKGELELSQVRDSYYAFA